jgi:hypothetical protein
MKRVFGLPISLLASVLLAQPQTLVMQNGLTGYSGCVDKELRDPSRNYSGGPKDTILEVSEI